MSGWAGFWIGLGHIEDTVAKRRELYARRPAKAKTNSVGVALSEGEQT